MSASPPNRGADPHGALSLELSLMIGTCRSAGGVGATVATWDLRVVTQLRPRFTKATQLFRNRALAYSKVGTRSERVIGHVTVNDQN